MLALILGMPHVANYATRAVENSARMCRVTSRAATCILRVMQTGAMCANIRFDHEICHVTQCILGQFQEGHFIPCHRELLNMHRAVGSCIVAPRRSMSIVNGCCHGRCASFATARRQFELDISREPLRTVYPSAVNRTVQLLTDNHCRQLVTTVPAASCRCPISAMCWLFSSPLAAAAQASTSTRHLTQNTSTQCYRCTRW